VNDISDVEQKYYWEKACPKTQQTNLQLYQRLFDESHVSSQALAPANVRERLENAIERAVILKAPPEK